MIPMPRPSSTLARRGFTLIEMIGALSILTILATVVISSVLQNLKRNAREIEAQNMASIMAGLRSSILRTKAIPCSTNWVPAVAAELGMAPNKILTTAAGQVRVLLFDPNCRVGITNTRTVPYVQTNLGSIQPISGRALLISSVASALPAAGLTNSTTDSFASLWSASSGTVPSIWTTNYPDGGADLTFQRLDLNTLFSRVILDNQDPTNGAPYSVDKTNSLTRVPAASRREMWFIRGTILNFHHTNNWMVAREYVVDDAGYTYEAGDWGRYVRQGSTAGSGAGLNGGDFGAMVARFLAASAPPNGTRRYSNQQWIVDSMFMFLWCFGEWSLDGFSGGSPWPHIPAYELSSSGASGLQNYSSDLLAY